MQMTDYLLFLQGEAATLNVRAQVVCPSQATTLPASKKTCTRQSVIWKSIHTYIYVLFSFFRQPTTDTNIENFCIIDRTRTKRTFTKLDINHAQPQAAPLTITFSDTFFYYLPLLVCCIYIQVPCIFLFLTVPYGTKHTNKTKNKTNSLKVGKVENWREDLRLMRERNMEATT
jgi:hypothetical protein